MAATARCQATFLLTGRQWERLHAFCFLPGRDDPAKRAGFAVSAFGEAGVDIAGFSCLEGGGGGVSFSESAASPQLVSEPAGEPAVLAGLADPEGVWLGGLAASKRLVGELAGTVLLMGLGLAGWEGEGGTPVSAELAELVELVPAQAELERGTRFASRLI